MHHNYFYFNKNGCLEVFGTFLVILTKLTIVVGLVDHIYATTFLFFILFCLY